ncbi:MAG: hypothetical protein ABFC96_01995 [Thermoguttaceae bacterium]
MDTALIIQGRIQAKQFVSDEPIPDVDGPAELIVYPTKDIKQPIAAVSIFDLFGKAEQLRSGEEIDAQVREEREAWGNR